MYNTPKLSILCAIYNGEGVIQHNIDRAVEALNGSNLEYEILISDDQSSDGSWKICKMIEQKYKGIVRLYRQKKNIGIYANYNFLIRKSKGEYFATMDQDDSPKVAFYDKAVNFLENNRNYSLAYSHARVISNQTNRVIRYEICFNMGVGKSPKERFFNTIANHETLAMAGVIRKEMFMRTKGYQNIPGGDHIFLNELSLYGNFHCSNEIGYDYYEDEDKYTNSSDIYKITGKRFYLQSNWIYYNAISIYSYPLFGRLDKFLAMLRVVNRQKIFLAKDIITLFHLRFWKSFLFKKNKNE